MVATDKRNSISMVEHIRSQEREQYADLIADMLAALKAARGVIDEHKAPLTFNRINAAIAKAEGRQLAI